MRPALLVLLCAQLAHADEPGDVPQDVTVILVGGSAGDGATPTLEAVERRLGSADPGRTVVVFTGNYSAAMLPEKGAAGRAQAESEILAHVRAVEDFAGRGGKVYFLPGHHDFEGSGGTQAVRRLKKLLSRSLGGEVMPHAACGTSTLLELSPKVGLMLVNSQWWMQQDPRADGPYNDGCEVKTARAFRGGLTDHFRDYRDRRLIIASHHPLRSYGELGGGFTPRAHLDPLPIVGTAKVLAKQSGLVPQHQAHPLVNSYVDTVLDEAERIGAYVFVSGHDANLQYLAVKQQTQIISGTSGATAAPATNARPGELAAQSPGWAELAIDASGEGEARYFSADGTPLFQAKLPPLVPLAPATGSSPDPMPRGPVVAGYSKDPVWKVPRAFQEMIGGYYSDAFALRLPWEVLSLDEEQLTPYRIGGGAQTNSLRLRDPEGGDWAIRSTTKVALRLLPYPINRLTPVSRMLDYAFTATQPEAALAVPRLAEAAGVLHLEPRLMYLPDQDALGEYRGFITDEVVLIEQRPHEAMLPPRLLGDEPLDPKDRFEDYEDLVDKLMEDPSRHRLDQEAMLRARLLDIFIGDWDRHRSQWRFAVTPGAGGARTYTPIPLDRDQVFANFDGLGLVIGRLLIGQARSLQPFNGKYGPSVWLNYNARDVDAVVLNRIPRERWMQIAADVQAALTDEVIDEAMSTWHPEAYVLDGARIARALKTRRDTLDQAASDFYELLSRNVDVVGSTKDDVFDVRFEKTGAARVTVAPREGTPFYDRRFRPDETAQLRLYALEGADVLRVHGEPHRRIDIRFVGGEGQDTITAAGEQPLEARAIRVYDSPNGAHIDPSIAVLDERSTVARLNQYEQRENHEPDYGIILPTLTWNSDDGVRLGAVYTWVEQGFKQHPYAASQAVSAFLSTNRLGVGVDYHGVFAQSVKLLDQLADVAVRTPNYTRNFFGFTNTLIDDPDNSDFYRVRQARFEGRYGLAHRFANDRGLIGGQALGQAIITERTPGRIVTASDDVSPGDLGPRYFGGARLFAQITTFDSLDLPRRGVALHYSIEGRTNIAGTSQLSMNHVAVAAAAIPLERSQRLVLITRARLEGIAGAHPFYFAPTLGAPQLRAYHDEQLAGDVAFAHTSDLRLDVFRIERVIPGTIGVNLSLDHGRVFGAGIAGSDYHVNCGGGLWWSIVDMFGVSVGYHRGLDGGSRFSFNVGPLFANPGF